MGKNINFHESGSASKAEFSCVQPVNPHMRCFADRLRTFHLTENWPNENIRATPLDTALGGFYYRGNKDSVKCWYCNGQVRSQDLEKGWGLF